MADDWAQREVKKKNYKYKSDDEMSKGMVKYGEKKKRKKRNPNRFVTDQRDNLRSRRGRKELEQTVKATGRERKNRKYETRVVFEALKTATCNIF